MRPSLACLVALAALSIGCRSSTKTKPEPAASPGAPSVAASAKATPPKEPERFGAAIQSRSTESLTQVLSRPAEYQGKTLVLEGEVKRACSRKGCWMELSSSEDPASPSCRVTFKDYGFFVPTDSAGAAARVEARVEVAELKPSYVEHMEQEGARFANKRADGSAEEVRLVATGVELWR